MQYTADAIYYARQEREQLQRWQEYAERAAERVECTRCGHRKDYHSSPICSTEVCATGPHGGGGYCDNDMHESGYCQCPAFVGEEDED